MNVEHDFFFLPVVTGTTEIVTEELENMWKLY